MEYALAFLGVILFSLAIYSRIVAPALIYEYQKGMLYRDGKFIKLLEPGRYRYQKSRSQILAMDMRKVQLLLPGQEILTKDNINLKMSLAGFYEVTDPVRAKHSSQNYATELYSYAQIALRDAVAGFTMDELLEKKNEIDALLLANIAGKAEAVGCSVSSLAVRDIMLPANLKKAFAGILEAKKEAQTQLEKARGEQAVLRSLANSAQLFEGNPQLVQARIIQTLSNGGNTIVFGVDKAVVTKT